MTFWISVTVQESDEHSIYHCSYTPWSADGVYCTRNEWSIQHTVRIFIPIVYLQCQMKHYNTSVWYEFGVEVILKKHQRIRLWAKNKREIKVCACVCTDSSVYDVFKFNLFKAQEKRLDEQLRYKRDKKGWGKPESASSIVVSSFLHLLIIFYFFQD